jgi:acyl-CoA synthetase (AMP-forming)/AMP-acid ligase II
VEAIGVVAADQRVTAAEIIDWCRTRIAAYKTPRPVEFVEVLPGAGFFLDEFGNVVVPEGASARRGTLRRVPLRRRMRWRPLTTRRSAAARPCN